MTLRIDGNDIRSLALREGLRLFGYPDEFHFEVPICDAMSERS